MHQRISRLDLLSSSCEFVTEGRQHIATVGLGIYRGRRPPGRRRKPIVRPNFPSRIAAFLLVNSPTAPFRYGLRSQFFPRLFFAPTLIPIEFGPPVVCREQISPFHL